MKIRSCAAAAAWFSILAGMATSIVPAGAATQSACALMPAAQASGILGNAVTAVDRPNPIFPGSTTCMYLADKHPIVQLAVSVMETSAEADAAYKTQLQRAVSHPNVASRQKGNIIVSDITMTGDHSKLAALLDAAVKNL